MSTIRQLKVWLLLTMAGTALTAGGALAGQSASGTSLVQLAQNSDSSADAQAAAKPASEATADTPAQPKPGDSAAASETKPAAEAKAEETKSAAASPAEARPAEAQAEAQAIGQKADATPADTKPAETKSAPTKSADAAPVAEEAKPAAPAAAAPADPGPKQSAAQAPAAADGAALVAAIKDRAARFQVGAADKESLAALQAYYGKPDAAPLWIAAGAFNARATSALKALAEADDWGLEAKAFTAPAAPAAGASPDQLAEAELQLGVAALKYARFASGGRLDTTKLGKYIDVKPSVAEPAAVVAALAASQDANAVLTGFHPKHPQFIALRAALAKARAPAEAAPKVAEAPAAKTPAVKIPDGPLLKVGVKHEHVALLRQRLSVRAASPDAERLFDAKLAEAVKEFQSGTEIKATGAVNNATRHALNGDGSGEAKAAAEKPNPQRDVQRIVLSMERWRWLPADLGSVHVWDNIPEFMTRVEKAGRVIHQEKIIVGKTDTQTPIFSAKMQFVVFHPEWGVPDSIKVKEILPYLRRPAQDSFFGFGGGGADTRVLQRHNLRVSVNGRPVDASQIDWNTVDIRQFQFVQPSGGQNVLGVVKFRFPNKHDVYMHDTPQRELFSAKTRTFSHGCMRVHNPQRLAEVILGEDQGMSPAEVANLIARGGGATEITLKNQFPVHVTYMTAVVGEDGNLQTFADIYGHDGRLQLALSGKQTEFIDAPDVAERPDALARQARINTKRKGPPPSQAGPGSFLSALFGN